MSLKQISNVCCKGDVACAQHAAGLGNSSAPNRYANKKERKDRYYYTC